MQTPTADSSLVNSLYLSRLFSIRRHGRHDIAENVYFFQQICQYTIYLITYMFVLVKYVD